MSTEPVRWIRCGSCKRSSLIRRPACRFCGEPRTGFELTEDVLPEKRDSYYQRLVFRPPKKKKKKRANWRFGDLRD